MNERIRELVLEARKALAVDAMGGGEFNMKAYEEKFAELIVQECASFADKHNQQKLYEDYTLGVGKAIKKHFGVE